MKNSFFLFLILFISQLLSAQTNEEPKAVNWVHGFLGEESSWEGFDTYFKNNYNIESKRVYYPSKNGLEKCAEIAMEQLVYSDAGTLVVAHSMGGLVTRQMIELGAPIDAYITYGTPHLGTKFANNYNNGGIEKFTTEFSSEVFVDILGAVFTPQTTTIFDFVVNVFGVDDPNLIGQQIFYFVEKKIKDGTDDQTIGNMRLHGAYIQSLSQPNVPKVNFYGVENSPVHWRFLGSYMDGSSGEQLVETMDDLKNVYETVRYISLSTSSVCLSFPFTWIPGCTTLGLYSLNLGTQLGQAVDHLDNSEAAWLSLIGALDGIHEICYTEEVLVGFDYDRDGVYDARDKEIRDSCRWSKTRVINVDSMRIELDINCEEEKKPVKPLIETKSPFRPDPCRDYREIYENYEFCSLVYDQKPTDGFIVDELTKEDNTYDWIKFNNLNHQELKSHPNTKQNLENLFTNVLIFDLDKYEIFNLKKE